MQKFPSIEQFRHVIRAVRDHCSFHGKPIPTLKLVGTIKLHGTNAGIHRDQHGDYTYLSRNRAIKLGDDNAGFVAYMHQFEDTVLHDVFATYANEFNDGEGPITIFGEWCGPGMPGCRAGCARREHDRKRRSMRVARLPASAPHPLS